MSESSGGSSAQVPAYETIEVRTEEHITTVRLNRPDALNAITSRMAAELDGLLAHLEHDDATRVVVLTGNGRGFCAGADLGDLTRDAFAAGEHGAGEAGPAPGGDGVLRPAWVRQYMRLHAVRLAERLLSFDKPMIAAVNGPCAGAGIGLALACDLVIASEEAVFSVVFVRRGLVPDYGVSYLLPRLVGLRKARELCLSGDKLSAEEADRLGLLTRVVPAAELDGVAAAEARRLAEGPGVALRLTKRLLAESYQSDAGQALDREFTYQAIAMGSADALEGVQAFLEKRPPRFTSR